MTMQSLFIRLFRSNIKIDKTTRKEFDNKEKEIYKIEIKMNEVEKEFSNRKF